MNMCRITDPIIKQMEKTVRECGDILLHADRDEHFVSSKEGHGNFVTVYDKKIQEKLRGSLNEILPEAAFVGEEEDIHPDIHEGFAFVVDPIQNTEGFFFWINGSIERCKGFYLFDKPGIKITEGRQAHVLLSPNIAS